MHPKTAPRLRLCLLASAGLLFTARLAMAGAPQPLTACDQTVKGPVYLVGDLDCTGYTFGVNLRGPGAALDLAGFSIRNTAGIGVQCFANCTITGPGTIENTSHEGIRAPYRAKIRGVTVRNSGYVNIGAGYLRLEDSVVEGSTVGVYVGGRGKILRSTITGAAASGLQVGLRIGGGNGPCDSGHATIRDSVIQGNALGAPSADCTVEHPCADIQACYRPSIDDAAACDQSVKLNTAEPWGICAFD